MCKYSDFTGYKCPHENLKDSDYCIFHLQDDNKDIDEFNKGIKEILEAEEDSINFNGFYFPSYIDFSTQNFRKKVIFIFTTFSGHADFSEATFSGVAGFWGATFLGRANFSATTFSGDTDFSSATFSGYADFLDASFSGYADFSSAKFSGITSILAAKFSGDANFLAATFSEYANFCATTFSGDTDFSSAKFSRKADFLDASFSRKADFFGAKFSGAANFSSAKFSGDANFRHAELTGKFIFIPNKSETIIFNYTDFSDNVRIKADMSKCSFTNSNIERVDMTDSSWMRDDDKTKNSVSAFIKKVKNKVGLSETPIIIWEEQQGELKDNWKELEGIYRRLKQSYQKFGDNYTAGRFYYQEMECKRKQLNWFRKLFWNVFYEKLCGYGEKPFNVIWASLFLILLSAFSYLFGGIEFVGSSILKVPPNVIDYNLSLNSFGIQWAIRNIDSVLEDFLLCIYTSVITFTTLGYGDVHPIGFSRIVASVEAGFGIIMTALFIFVFTRKMLR